MRIRLLALLFVLMMLALAGCSAAAPAGPASQSNAAAPVIDIANLPETVDVAMVKALQDNPSIVILDVREPDEYKAGHIPGIKPIPMGEVADRLAEIPKDKPVIVTCQSGNRSGQVAKYLREQGYTNIHNMQGGFGAWQAAGYPVEK
jgi:rhodanese-related sulfurtransferase